MNPLRPAITTLPIVEPLMKIPTGLDLETKPTHQADTEIASIFLGNFFPGNILPENILPKSILPGNFLSGKMFTGNVFDVAGGLILSQTLGKLVSSLLFSSSIPVITQVAVRANEISAEYAPIWFINFPPVLGEAEKDVLREYMDEILNFRSWSSLKWWTDAFNTVPSTDEGATIKMRQSSEFARAVFRDMVRMPWLRTTRESTSYTDEFECHVNDLHANLVARTMASWGSLNKDSILALEPVLQRVLASIETGEAMSSSSQVRSVLSERYEYENNARTIIPYLRLVCFEVAEAVRDVVDGKNSSHRQVECRMIYLYYEAEFNMEDWKIYNKSINDEQKIACREFVMRQTVIM